MVDLFFGLSSSTSGGFLFWFGHFFRRFNIHHLIPQLYLLRLIFFLDLDLDLGYYRIGLSLWFFMHHVWNDAYETGVGGCYCKCSFYQKKYTTFCCLEPSK